jgi:hypothetical protein
MRCLREGLKEKYESWRMWENLFFISLDVGEFSESIHAVDRLLDLKWGETHPMDLEAIGVLVDGTIQLCTEMAKDVDGKPNGFRILDRLDVLMERLVEKGTKHPELWSYYAQLQFVREENTKAVECLQSAYRAQQSAVGDRVGSDRNAFEKVVKSAIALGEGTLRLKDEKPDTSLYAARSSLRNLISLTKEHFSSEALFSEMEAMFVAVKSRE